LHGSGKIRGKRDTTEERLVNIGIPKEVKRHEYRVSATPGTVQALVARRHRVVVETGAGLGSGFDDKDYQARGAPLAMALRYPQFRFRRAGRAWVIMLSDLWP
jgi:hypothetical protein